MINTRLKQQLLCLATRLLRHAITPRPGIAVAKEITEQCQTKVLPAFKVKGRQRNETIQQKVHQCIHCMSSLSILPYQRRY